MKPVDLQETLMSYIPNGIPAMIKGAPGVGKSDIITQACLATGADLIIEHPVVADPTDFKGLPFARKGQAEFLPFGSLRKIIEAKTRTVYFLDDLGQAPVAVQAATMQLILARRINGHHVSDQVTFIAATNRHKDRSGVTGILESVKTRWATILELTPDVNDWCNWALKNNMPTELIAFIRFRPELLHDFKPTNELTNSPCPRTVANVGRLMNLGTPSHLEFEIFSGSAGEGFASELVGFLKIFRTLPNPDTVLMHPDTAIVPDDPATLYAICGALSRKASDQTIERLVTYANRLPDEFSVLMITDSEKINPDIANSRAFIQWATDHNDVMM